MRLLKISRISKCIVSSVIIVAKLRIISQTAQWYIYLFFRLSEQYKERVTDQRSKNREERAKRAHAIGNLERLGNLKNLGIALPTFILKLPTFLKLPKLPKLPNKPTFQPVLFVVKSREMWVIAKIPSMGCTWRTAH